MDSQPIVSHKNNIVENNKQDSGEKLGMLNVKYTVYDFSEAVTSDFMVEHPAGKKEDCNYHKLAQDRKHFFHMAFLRSETSKEKGESLAYVLSSQKEDFWQKGYLSV